MLTTADQLDDLAYRVLAELALHREPSLDLMAERLELPRDVVEHTLEALRTAAKSPWVQVDFARINPIGSHMDGDPDTVVSVLREMKAAGKAVVGMKILGQGDMRDRVDEALKYALGLGLLDAFTIGAESRPEQLDLIRTIAAVSA